MSNMYDTAIVVQDACNMKGIVNSFNDILQNELRDLDTEAIWKHPVTRLFADKIFDLTTGTDYCEAYKICKERCEDDYNK